MRAHTKTGLLVATLVLMVASSWSQSSPAQLSAATTASAAHVTQLLNGSGYQYTKKTETVWTTPFNGKSLKNFTVILAVQDDLLVTFVIVAKKANIQVTPEFMFTLLRANHSLDHVKVGLDDDGDLFVRNDSSVRILDAEEFKAEIKQVAAAADEVHEKTASFITAK
jgi:hypothetical protein